MQSKVPCGRFAPSPSGRLHLGNVLCALLAYLSVKHVGGKALLRIEDIDTARCAGDRVPQMIDDLHWLGFHWDDGEQPETYQSNRTAIYEHYFDLLNQKGLLYPCYCTRAELHAASAPHGSDGQPVYDGRCKHLITPPANRRPAWRIRVPDETIEVADGLQGRYSERLDTDCGDFLLRRSDGVFAYQLAVVVDDALTGVNEVVRGKDLLSSTPRQIYLYRLLGFEPPAFYHIPLLLREDGTRLAKRDGALDMGALRERFSSPEEIIGMLACNVGLLEKYRPVSVDELIPLFNWDLIKREDIRLDTCGIV